MALYSKEGCAVNILDKKNPFIGRANLIKQSVDLFPDKWLEAYYTHLITNFIFPGSVISIATTKPNTNRQASYFSKLGDIPEEHAVFSQHMEPRDGKKYSHCDCNSCITHRKLHKSHINSMANEKAEIFKKFGIYLPQDDPSDFCCEADGNIIFFEVDHLNTNLLINSLGKTNLSPSKKANLERIVERLESIY